MLSHLAEEDFSNNTINMQKEKEVALTSHISIISLSFRDDAILITLKIYNIYNNIQNKIYIL